MDSQVEPTKIASQREISVALREYGSLETAANWAQIVSLAAALPSLVQVVRQLSRLPAPVAVSIGSAKTVLADAGSVQWNAETARRRLTFAWARSSPSTQDS